MMIVFSCSLLAANRFSARVTGLKFGLLALLFHRSAAASS